jgi:hypothetical protein
MFKLFMFTFIMLLCITIVFTFTWGQCKCLSNTFTQSHINALWYVNVCIIYL